MQGSEGGGQRCKAEAAGEIENGEVVERGGEEGEGGGEALDKSTGGEGESVEVGAGGEEGVKALDSTCLLSQLKGEGKRRRKRGR